MLKIYEFIKKKVNNTSIFIIVIIKLYYPLSLLHTLILSWFQSSVHIYNIFKYFKLIINQSTCFLSIIFF